MIILTIGFIYEWSKGALYFTRHPDDSPSSGITPLLLTSLFRERGNYYPRGTPPLRGRGGFFFFPRDPLCGDRYIRAQSMPLLRTIVTPYTRSSMLYKLGI